jgi:Tfp pilus assembly protein PilF
LKTCPKCNAEYVFDGAQFCKNCGAPLEVEGSHPKPEADRKSGDDLEFVVTETSGVPPEDIPKNDSRPKKPADPEDHLEITTNAYILEDNAAAEVHKSDDTGIDSGPEIPPPPPTGPPEKSEDWETISKKLSDEELAAIKENLYGPDKKKPSSKSSRPRGEPKTTPSPPPAPDTKRREEETVKVEPYGLRPIDDPALSTSTVQKSNRIRGVAYFRKNTIKIVGNPFLHEGDEIAVNNKTYMLRPKPFDKRIYFGILAGALVIILLILGIQIAGKSTLSGDGEIVGMILDEYGQPYLEGARVSIPSLNKKTITNAQGFFRFQMIPTGTYELEYELGNKYVGRGNATVTAHESTLMTFSNLKPILAEKKSTKSVTSRSGAVPSSTTTNKKIESSGSTNKEPRGYGKIRLDANVENARLKVDDKILGAGNNTYSNIRSGLHTVTVDKSGYREYTKDVEVLPDRTVTLKANLIRDVDDSPKKLAAKDYLSLGNDALAQKDYSRAVRDYTKAIELSPGSAEAHSARAGAYLETGDYSRAVDDYVRTGEICRINRQYNSAISAFSSALTYDSGNLAALVGRGGSKLDNGDYRPALSDYEAALEIDDMFYPALFGGGICQFKLGNHKKAEKYFKQAYELDSTEPYLYQYMMLNYLARDNIKKVRKTYAEFKVVASPAELAEFKSSTRFEPILRLIKEEDR